MLQYTALVVLYVHQQEQHLSKCKKADIGTLIIE